MEKILDKVLGYASMENRGDIMNEYETIEQQIKNNNLGGKNIDYLLKLVERDKNGIYISKEKATELLEALEESITNAKIEFDESGYIATTLHTNTIKEQKAILFDKLQRDINKLKQALGGKDE
jgi:hypothetical protein